MEAILWTLTNFLRLIPSKLNGSTDLIVCEDTLAAT